MTAGEQGKEFSMSSQPAEAYREVSAAILVGTCGRILLQQRDDKPGLLYAGLIGLFGGHREGSETHLDCLQRELVEEIGEQVAPERCEHLVSFAVQYPQGGGVKGEFYVVRGLPIDRLVIMEGSPLIVAQSEMPALLPRMTPSCCYVVRLFLEQTSRAA